MSALTATEQRDALIDLYSLLTSCSLVFAADNSDIQVMERFTGLFDYFASSPKDITEFNRRWILTFEAARQVVMRMEQGRISVIQVGGTR
jgi:hypothetical protein